MVRCMYAVSRHDFAAASQLMLLMRDVHKQKYLVGVATIVP